ncbi:amidohydrolase family protein [Sphingobium ummariense]|uniref:amidohydrolase family protein n=1 Tax=Sphingobium ummariense TaxID=420994 RepID=UPI00041AC883|nr:amidohydrolase family protein [Sphingobium ummariense]
MRIDAHHHLWRYDPAAFEWIEARSAIARDFSVADLDAAMALANIDGAIAVQARQTEEETEFLLETAAKSDRIIGVVGWIDLRAPDIEERLKAGSNPLLLGYRHVVQDEPDADFLLADDFVRGVRAVVANSLTYDLLVNHAQLPAVPAFLERVGPGRFVLDHAAKPAIASGGWQPWADQIAAAARHPHLWCKVSGLVTEADHRSWRPSDIERYLAHVLEQFGPERLIWGSDWPVCLLAAPYSAVHDLIADFVTRQCPAFSSAIFGGNAVDAYALKPALP